MGRALLAGMALLALIEPATASPTLAGPTGLIKVPTAEVLGEGQLELGFSWMGGAGSYLYDWTQGGRSPSAVPAANRMYYASLGLLPGLEITLDMMQVVGLVDPEAPGTAFAIHRFSHVRYRLPVPGPVAWAVGMVDPLSVNGLVRGEVGQTDYGLTGLYGVASWPLGPVSLHGGYGQSRDFLRGVFGGVEASLPLGLRARAEYDSQDFSVGALWQPWPWLRLQGARIFPDSWGGGLALTWGL